MSGLTFQERTARWRTAKFPDESASDVFQKLVEEVGELAKAMVGEREHRAGRGDAGDEAADVLLVLASLIGKFYPHRDLFTEAGHVLTRCEVELEMGAGLFGEPT